MWASLVGAFTLHMWNNRWANWSDEQLEEVLWVRDRDHQRIRIESYATTILEHVQPESTLDIGGGPGELGALLPGKYTVMDHPRIKKYTNAEFLPIGSEIGYYDLVVNTNSWGETDIPTVTSYIEQIERAGCKWLYSNNRKRREVSWCDYPLENWETIVERDVKFAKRFTEWLGRR